MGIRTHDQVVTLPALREIFSSVINDMSAPIDRAVSTFLVLHTAVTPAPNDLAVWTANVPTPPDAPSTRTLWPGWTRPFAAITLLVWKKGVRFDAEHLKQQQLERPVENPSIPGFISGGGPSVLETLWFEGE